MGFLNVLKGIETGVIQTGAIVAQIEGLNLNNLLPAKADKVANKVEVTIDDLTNIVKQVQVMGSQSGMTDAQKLSAEAALAGQILSATGHIDPKLIGDQALVVEGVTDLMAAIVKIQRGLKHQA